MAACGGGRRREAAAGKEGDPIMSEAPVESPKGRAVPEEGFRRRPADGCGRDDRAPRKVAHDRGRQGRQDFPLELKRNSGKITAMSQGLHLSQRMSLSQVLAPQLQQSLELLQAPTLELKALVEQEVQQNPCLEEVPTAEMEQLDRNRDEGSPANDPSDLAEPPADVMFDPATEKPSSAPVDDFQAEFEKLTQMDQEWRDHFAQTNLPMRQGPEAEERRQFMFDSLVAGTSLQETLLEQMRFSEMTEEQRRIGEMIIGNIDERGYLKETRGRAFLFLRRGGGEDRGGAEDRPDFPSAGGGGAGFAGVPDAATGAGREREDGGIPDRAGLHGGAVQAEDAGDRAGPRG